MIKLDEEAFICDLAETYQIYDYRQLPPSRVAVFAFGLRDDSRIKMKASKQSVSMKNLLLAGILDELRTLVWFQTKDGQKGNNRPKMLLELLAGSEKQRQSDVIVFDSSEEFSEARKNQLVGGD